MELQDYLHVVRKRWRVILLVVLVTVAAAAAATLAATKQYESTSQYFVSTTGSDDSGSLLQGSTFTQQRVKSYTQLLTTPRILEPVAEAVGGSADALASEVTATSPPDTVLIEVAVRDPDPARATAIGEAIAAEFPSAVSELESPEGGASSPVKVTVVQAPSTPTSPASPQPVRNLALGVVLGLLLGLGAAVLREMLDKGVRTAEDVKAITDVPVLGSIAFDPETPKRPLIVEVDPRSPRAEAFRSLRTNLQFVDAATHPRTIAVTSSVAGEGKSTVTANLALTMAQAGSRVCLVEGDLRRPKVLDYMGLEGAVGLTDALIDRADVMDLVQPYGGTSLWVLGAGHIPPNPSELLGSSAMRTLLEQLRVRFDYVVIDAPPALPVTDAVVLSKVTDGAIVVVGAGIVDRDQVSHALDTLGSVGGRALGVVLNRVPPRALEAYGHYSYETPEHAATRRERARVSQA
ncbi:polysaccharide biosynthesis tyrosine autokinase [Phycicoccus endophyticus]|uniref:polysaccharide biosynthesis tyrosine autokinase n=1 Tax=Phycicoccus endophyticus TaxID=1690220 RepID=UPI001408C0C5|nr:polysaccharide biosynthesis tyrosine autokinase [Phycicoccus endophyticus]NHI20390.1 polysaccharide biosynthesis tyrosine autokinase [Phycicoccus endophyticus]GGL29600.1 chromosome partitioning protein [Phycicoccus endophyticus]